RSGATAGSPTAKDGSGPVDRTIRGGAGRLSVQILTETDQCRSDERAKRRESDHKSGWLDTAFAEESGASRRRSRGGVAILRRQAVGSVGAAAGDGSEDVADVDR